MQLDKNAPYEIIQELLNCLVFVIDNVVVVGISENTPEHEAPSNPFNAVLSVIDVTTSYLSVYVIM